MIGDDEVGDGGVFTISLDFELYWGMADLVSLDDTYRAVLTATRDEVVPRLLDVFEQYDIHATWATVGFLFANDRSALEAAAPDHRPRYHDPGLSAYRHLDDVGPDEAADPWRLAPSLVSEIKRRPHQEIGSHSFSHFYCLEPGADADAFSADLAAWSSAAEPFDVDASSICFGRNQYDQSAVEVCRRHGFVAYRGAEPWWCYQPTSRSADTFVRKVLRRLDAHLPLLAHHCPTPSAIAAATPAGGPYDIASSRFLRAATGGRTGLLDWLRVHRVIAGLRHAASTGGVYHLWWHPQDFAVDVEASFDMLHAILASFSKLRDERGMVSRTMAEVADLVAASPTSSGGPAAPPTTVSN